jgi:glucokinase
MGSFVAKRGLMTSTCHTIGIDLGGTQVRAALMNACGSLTRRVAERTDVDGGPTAVIKQLERLISEVSGSGGADRPCAIGVSAPGPLDSETGTILHIPTLPGWEDFPLKKVLSDKFRLPIALENDGIAAAFGEWRFGAGRGLRHLVYVTVSTGIGGGVVIDGRLLHGRRGMAAHVGHFRMAPGGPVCSCGATGCFEALAAGTALGKAGQIAARENPASLLAQMAPFDAIEACHVVEAARQADPIAKALIDRESDYLGAGFTGLIHLFGPERVIMGGGVSKAFDLLQARIHAVIRRDAMEPFKQVAVAPAGLGENSGLVGAAALAFEAALAGTTAKIRWR